jgi:hypothetical protein
MPDSQTSFWTPARIGCSSWVIGAVQPADLLIVALAYAVSLPQNKFQPAGLGAALEIMLAEVEQECASRS